MKKAKIIYIVLFITLLFSCTNEVNAFVPPQEEFDGNYNYTCKKLYETYPEEFASGYVLGGGDNMEGYTNCLYTKDYSIGGGYTATNYGLDATPYQGCLVYQVLYNEEKDHLILGSLATAYGNETPSVNYVVNNGSLKAYFRSFEGACPPGIYAKVPSATHSMSSGFIINHFSNTFEGAAAEVKVMGNIIPVVGDAIDALFEPAAMSLASLIVGAGEQMDLVDENIPKGKIPSLLTNPGSGVIYSCDIILGEDMIRILQGVYNIIKIAVPLILVVLGSLDMLKAVFAGSEDNIKKAQGKLIKRVVIAVAIFLVPTFLGILMKMGNQIWPDYINNTFCGINL